MRAGVGAWDAAGWWGTRRAGTGSGHPKRAREALTCQQSLAMSFHSWQTRANGPRHRRGARRKTRWPRSETRSTSHKLQLPHAACRRSAVLCCKAVSGPCNMAWMARCVCISRTHVPGSSLDEPGCDGVNAGDIVCCAVDGSIIPSLRAAVADEQQHHVTATRRVNNPSGFVVASYETQRDAETAENPTYTRRRQASHHTLLSARGRLVSRS